jgi:plasmid stabilization system protein ParE
MPTLKWTPAATDDLWSIDDWLTENASGEFALATLVAIRVRASFLENCPRAGRPIGEGVRLLRVIDTPHLIFYRTVEDIVEILRVMHEREDWQVQF